jgi:hypothetical protein
VKFIYKPEGVEPKVWDFVPGDIPSDEGEEIEDLTGMLFDEWVEKAQKGSIKAIRALLYILLKREKPELRYANVKFTINEIDWDTTAEENAYIIEVVEAMQASGDKVGEDLQATYDEIKAKKPQGKADPKD